jgi:hypothetical protein
MFLTRGMLLEATWRRLGDSRGCYRRSCDVCSTVFFVSRPEGRYCRPACRQRAYRRRLKRRRPSALITAPT